MEGWLIVPHIGGEGGGGEVRFYTSNVQICLMDIQILNRLTQFCAYNDFLCHITLLGVRG